MGPSEAGGVERRLRLRRYYFFGVRVTTRLELSIVTMKLCVLT
jgi:hypothetical protein